MWISVLSVWIGTLVVWLIWEGGRWFWFLFSKRCCKWVDSIDGMLEGYGWFSTSHFPSSMLVCWVESSLCFRSLSVHLEGCFWIRRYGLSWIRDGDGLLHGRKQSCGALPSRNCKQIGTISYCDCHYVGCTEVTRFIGVFLGFCFVCGLI